MTYRRSAGRHEYLVRCSKAENTKTVFLTHRSLLADWQQLYDRRPYQSRVRSKSLRLRHGRISDFYLRLIQPFYPTFPTMSKVRRPKVKKAVLTVKNSKKHCFFQCFSTVLQQRKCWKTTALAEGNPQFPNCPFWPAFEPKKDTLRSIALQKESINSIKTVYCFTKVFKNDFSPKCNMATMLKKFYLF